MLTDNSAKKEALTVVQAVTNLADIVIQTSTAGYSAEIGNCMLGNDILETLQCILYGGKFATKPFVTGFQQLRIEARLIIVHYTGTGNNQHTKIHTKQCIA